MLKLDSIEKKKLDTREKEKGTTYSGQFLDVLIRSPKAGQTNLLRELSEGRVSKQRHMTKQLVAHIAGVTENHFHNIYKKKEQKYKQKQKITRHSKMVCDFSDTTPKNFCNKNVMLIFIDTCIYK